MSSLHNSIRRTFMTDSIPRNVGDHWSAADCFSQNLKHSPAFKVACESTNHNAHAAQTKSSPVDIQTCAGSQDGVASSASELQRPKSRKPPPIKRATRAVLTKEQATEVYQQKLNNEASCAFAGARVTANAATIARRLGTHHSPLQKTLLHTFSHCLAPLVSLIYPTTATMHIAG